MKIYTAGYTGHKPEQLKAIAEKLDAVVVDIRYSTKSRVPHWTNGYLLTLLGRDYKWNQFLGNRNYKSGPIEIVDMVVGIRMLNWETKNIILLCACKNRETCHRDVVAKEIERQTGEDVNEVDWSVI